MQYTKTTFQNDLSPAINATWLNTLGSTVQSLAANAINRATIDSGTTSSNYNISISGYSTVPSSGELPFVVLMTPSATNVSPCTITPSWGTTAYTIKDPKKNINVQAGAIISGTPCEFAFDGTYFWYMGSVGLVAGVDYVAFPAQLTALPTSGTALNSNAEYRVASEVNTYAFAWPAGNFHVWMRFTTGSSAIISFPSGTTYCNGAPTFAASTTYELDIKDGVVAWAEVSDS